jgi:phosphinothricin acetyltransferase
VEIRHATKEDLDAVLAIFNHEIINGVNAWDTEPIVGAECQRWFDAHGDPAYPLLVAENAPGVVGWGSLSKWAPHGAYDRTAETSIYVHRAERRRGIGSSLLAKLISVARRVGHHSLIGRAEVSNQASRRLHLRAGFEPVGIMHEVGFKFGRFLDAELFELILTPSA